MNTSFTQTKEYLKWHQAVGTKTFYKEFFELENHDVAEGRYFQIDDEREFEKVKNIYAIVVCIVLELRIGKVLYVPYGPVFLGNISHEQKNKVLKYLNSLATKENCVFVRFEIQPEEMINNTALWGDKQNIYPAGQNYLSFLLGLSFSKIALINPPKKTFAKEGVFQPRVEWWLGLEKSEEELLNNFHKDHRYSIRRAQKENIQTEIVGIDETFDENKKEIYFKIFWELLNRTSERDGFSLYDPEYYKAIFSPGLAGGEGGVRKFLVFTKLQDKYMSVALVVCSGGVTNLVFAGSVTEKRETGFNHLMQWEAIKFSKKLGSEFYNFGGIYENGYGKETLQGVTNFKKRFGGFAKFHGDFVDMPIKKFKYLLYILRKMF